MKLTRTMAEYMPAMGSQPDVKELVESSDLILTIGAIKVSLTSIPSKARVDIKQSDFNTAGFSYKTSQLNTIDFHSTHIVVRYSEYPGVHMRGVLRKVIQQIDLSKVAKYQAQRWKTK